MDRDHYDPGVIIVDFDGCISICNWRESTLPANSRNKTYDQFHDLLYMDPPNIWMIDMMYRMKNFGYKVIILTGRPEAQRDISHLWLDKYGVLYDWMEMRGNNDFRSSETYKMTYIKKYYKDEIKMIFDDLPRVIDHLKSDGYPTFLVRAKV